MPRWTAEEKAVINRAVLEGTKARELERLLPGRRRPQIQCQLADARRRLRGDPSWNDLEAQKTRAGAALAQGVCRMCQRRLITDDGSLVHCPTCVEKRKSLPRPLIDTSRNEADLLPWIFSRHPGQLASWLPDARKVVVPFGGSGRLARAAVRRDHSVVYNDLHPLLGCYVGCLRDRKHTEINLAANEIAVDVTDFRAHYRATFDDPSDPVVGAATVRMAAFSARNCRLDEVEKVSFAPLLSHDQDSKLWTRMGVESRDFVECIRDHDGRRVAFLLDPPYPGTDYYEHNLDWARFRELLDLLAYVRGKFLMVLPTRRRTVRMAHERGMSCWMRKVRMNKGSGRDLVVANYPLGDASLEPVDAGRYGLLREPEKEETVERVVRAIAELGGTASRREVEERLGDDDPAIIGALLRARAEGRIEKAGRKDYRLAENQSLVTTPERPRNGTEKIVPEVLSEMPHVPFHISREKVVGDVGDFVATMNNMGYDVMFHARRGGW